VAGVSIFVTKEFQIDFVRRKGRFQPLKGFIGVVGVSYLIPDELFDGGIEPSWEAMVNRLVNSTLMEGRFKDKYISILNGALILNESDPLCTVLEDKSIGLFKFKGEPTTCSIGSLIASLISEQFIFDENVIHPMEVNFRIGDELTVVDL